MVTRLTALRTLKEQIEPDSREFAPSPRTKRSRRDVNSGRAVPRAELPGVPGLDCTYAFSYDEVMETVTVSGARGRLYRLLDEVTDSREPVLITGKRGGAVLVPEEDWRAIQETLYLLSMPGMRKSIREGMATPLSECATQVKW
jgi:prevent-host-death family protein